MPLVVWHQSANATGSRNSLSVIITRRPRRLAKTGNPQMLLPCYDGFAGLNSGLVTMAGAECCFAPA